MWVLALVLLGVLGAAVVFRDGVVVEFYKHRLAGGSLRIEECLRGRRGSLERRALDRFARTDRGAARLAALYLEDFETHLGPYWAEAHTTVLRQLDRAVLGLDTFQDGKAPEPDSPPRKALYWYKALCPPGCSRPARAGPLSAIGPPPAPRGSYFPQHTVTGCVYGRLPWSEALCETLQAAAGRVVEVPGYPGVCAAAIPTMAASIMFQRDVAGVMEYDGYPFEYAWVIERTTREDLVREVVAALRAMSTRSLYLPSYREKALESLRRMGRAGEP